MTLSSLVLVTRKQICRQNLPGQISRDQNLGKWIETKKQHEISWYHTSRLKLLGTTTLCGCIPQVTSQRFAKTSSHQSGKQHTHTHFAFNESAFLPTKLCFLPEKAGDMMWWLSCLSCRYYIFRTRVDWIPKATALSMSVPLGRGKQQQQQQQQMRQHSMLSPW